MLTTHFQRSLGEVTSILLYWQIKKFKRKPRVTPLWNISWHANGDNLTTF